MQAPVISKTLRVLSRPSRSGQSIILIALGFMALIAFVGIATDTAMLFVRYSTLRRAVDAAAIAAAGSIRQSSVASGSGFATVAASAEQYIKIHGLDPTSVRVDTCATEVYDYMTLLHQDTSGSNPTSTAAQAAATQHLAGQQGEELCTTQPQKLVRVSAQVQSQTSFLSLIGFNSITLSASSVSQTAVLDVAILLDASMSMEFDTAANAVDGTHGPITAFTDFTQLWPSTYTYQAYDSNNLSGAQTALHSLGSIRAECRGNGTDTSKGSYTKGNYAYAGCCDEPVTMTAPPDVKSATTWYVGLDGTINSGNVYSGENPESTIGPAAYKGRNYGPLICKPFKYVRDSARTFLTNVNFAQGDRAFLVVFDQAIHQLTSGGDYNSPNDVATATLPVFTTSDSAIQALNKYAGVEANPTGYQATSGGYTCFANYQAPYNLNQRHYNNDLGSPLTAPYVAIYETVAPCNDTNTGGAILAAQGVITNPSWIRRTAVWVMVLLSDGYPNRTPGIGAVSGKGGSPAIGGNNTYAFFHPIGDPKFNPAAADFPNFFTSYPPATTGNTTPGVVPLTLSGLTLKAITDPGFCPWYTFCDPYAGGYPSASSGQVDIDPAVNKLLDPKTGQPQVYSMYPDGYVDNINYDASNNPISINTNFRIPYAADPRQPKVPNAMTYNSLYCPLTDVEQDPLWWQADIWNVAASGVSSGTHYYQTQSAGRIGCTATDPDIRHFCMDVSTGAINPGDPTKCSIHYDPKDYARDMVDYAALIDYTTTVKGNSIAMYSIFFPHTGVTATNPNQDIMDNILGVKFMRYVADAGSDGTIKNHVQAWFRANNTQTDPKPPDYLSATPYNGANTTYYPATTEDACAKYDFRELNVLPGSNNSTPVLPDYPNGKGYENLYKTSCGNYYYADSASSINRAFVDIAGKLFTRLSH